MNKKKILIAISVVLFLIMVCIMIIYNSTKKQKIEDELPAEIIVEEEINSVLEPVTRKNNYYVVKNCLESFYMNCEELDSEDSVSAVYDMLDTKYINYKNITKDNLTKKVPKIKDSVVHITNMYVSEQSASFYVYIVEGALREKSSSDITNFKVIVQTDAINTTFSILLEDYINELGVNLKEGNTLILKEVKNIEANDNNTYKYKNINEQTYIEDLFDHYKEEIIYNAQLAYNRLDEEYKNARFSSLEEFSKYAKSNTKKNVMAKVDKYQKTEEDGYTQYVYLDQNENYYIFKVTSIMSYSLILDTYSVDLPEFLEKYNSASTTEKVGYNIQKCIDAINDKNYAYMYNKLDQTFKENNYKTLDSFENKIKKNLFDINKVEDVKALNEGDTYIYKMKVVDTSNTDKSVEMTVIMQLLEGTGFVMSFSF